MLRRRPTGPAQAGADLVGRGHQHGVAGGLPDLADRAGPEHDGPARLADEAGDGPGEHLGVARLGLGLPLLGGRRDVVALGGRVEHHRQQLGARRPVDGGVVDLGEDGEAVVGQALDDVGLPQRAGCRSSGRPMMRATRSPSWLVGPRGRDGGVAHVEVEVEVGVLDPERVVEARTGTLAQPAPQRLEQVQALLDLRRATPASGLVVGVVVGRS